MSARRDRARPLRRDADDASWSARSSRPRASRSRFTLARAGDRAGAFVLDMLIQVGVIVASRSCSRSRSAAATDSELVADADRDHLLRS